MLIMFDNDMLMVMQMMMVMPVIMLMIITDDYDEDTHDNAVCYHTHQVCA